MINVKVSSEHTNVHISAPGRKNIKVGGNVIKVTPETYKGDYQVTPLAEEETVLKTKDKYMTDNVTVLEVPFYKTSNPSGGETAYIAQNMEE